MRERAARSAPVRGPVDVLRSVSETSTRNIRYVRDFDRRLFKPLIVAERREVDGVHIIRVVNVFIVRDTLGEQSSHACVVNNELGEDASLPRQMLAGYARAVSTDRPRARDRHPEGEMEVSEGFDEG